MRIMTTHCSQDFAAVGSYVPRGFTIQLIHPDFKLDQQGKITMPHDRFPTFMHEYSHLLQDTGTFRGAIDYLSLLEQVTAVAAHSLASGATISYPVIERNGIRHRLPPDHSSARDLDRLREMTEPREKWKTGGKVWAYQQSRVINRNLSLGGMSINVPFVYMDFVDNVTNDTLSHQVGAWEIKEAYAVAVGILHGGKPKDLAKAGYEYLAIDRYLTYHFGAVSPRQTVALCHWSLQHLSPARFLEHLVEQIKDNYSGLPPAEEILDVARSIAVAQKLPAIWQELLTDQYHATETACRQAGNDAALLFKWLRQRSSQVLSKQFASDNRFPLDTFLCQDSTAMPVADQLAALERMLQDYPIPIVFASDGSAHTLRATQEDHDAVFVSRATLDLFQHVWGASQPTRKCPLYDACNLSIKDAACLTRPWEKGTLARTCAYGIAAKLHGMQPHQTFTLEPFASQPASAPAGS